MKDLFERLLSEQEKGNDTMLVTITGMNGSSPRGKGAQMLVGKKGLLAGTIGGGAAEGRAIEMAISMIDDGKSGSHEFILNNTSDDNEIDSVCGGGITIWMSYVDHTSAEWKSLAGDVIGSIEDRRSAAMTIYRDGRVPVINDGLPGCEDAGADEFLMEIPIGERAVIFGAGHCSKALAPILTSVGFRVTVMDDRPELVSPENFPTAEQLIADDYKNADNILGIGSDDYVVIMTAGHRADYEMELMMAKKEPAYLGVIGSRSKVAYVQQRLLADGIPQDVIDKIHSPIGLKIHSITPAEVAISITAQMISERYENRARHGKSNEKYCPV